MTTQLPFANEKKEKVRLFYVLHHPRKHEEAETPVFVKSYITLSIKDYIQTTNQKINIDKAYNEILMVLDKIRA